MKTTRSRKLFAQAQKFFPGGVNSPVRAFGAVGGEPLFFRRGKGSRVWDEDGNSYIDMVMSWGALLLGHAAPAVVSAVTRAVKDGSSFGAPTAAETELAQMIRAAIPSMEMMRLVSSGTEAAMSAIRVSRGFTGRDKIIKFDGCYHGHGDSLLVKAGSGAATQGIPGSQGVSRSLSRDTIVCPYNDVDFFRRVIERDGKNIASVIIEPVAANMGVVLPKEGFLEEVRRLTEKHGIVLIFDEVISGFRLHYGGAQELYKVRPDLTCLGKIIGGGLPIGAYGGRKDILSCVAPLGGVYQAGTLSGNPVAVAAGLANLKALKRKNYQQLNDRTTRLCRGLAELLAEAGIPAVINGAGSLFTVFFTGEPVTDFATAKTADTARYARVFQAMLRHGVYLAPSQFEAAFLSFAHTDQDVRAVLDAARMALEK